MSEKHVENGNPIRKLFGVNKPVIGMLHLPPLPGSPRYSGETMAEIVKYALSDMDAYLSGGVNGFIVENHGDIPFLKPEEIGPETIAAMSVVAAEVARTAKPGNLPVGINCLANHAVGALAIARAAEADFVRVNQWVNAYVANEGFVEGKAGVALRYRSKLRAEHIAIFADVVVKHGSHSITADRSITEQTRDALFFCADVLIATGSRTGDTTPVETIREIRQASKLPVLAGSGVDLENAVSILEAADGAIVGSSLKQGGVWQNRVDAERVKALMAKVKRLQNPL
jgi:membrane complex biogenesis BtpA family protein